MNALDYVIIIAVAIGALHGLRRGALGMVTSVVSLVAGLYLASEYYARAADLAARELGTSPNVSSVIGYIAVFAIVFVVVGFIGGFVSGVLRTIHLGWLDNLAGAVVGGAIVAIICGLAVMLIAAVLPSDAQLLRQSKLAPMVLTYEESLVAMIPDEVKATYERHRDDLMRYWIDTALKAREATPTPTASPSPSH
ncbi:MAG TPA: CvpA family protein [Candidatus Binataceae bacterium]|nr:CvpA family protein [Candidatus Binataceae bacterium]